MMKSIFKSLLILLLGTGALIFAESLERPPGEPPFGVAVQGDAPGTKLTGEVFIELHNINPAGNQADARIVLRLRRNNDFATLYGEAPDIDISSPLASQNAIMDEMVPLIIDRFFGTGTFDVRLKSLEEFGRTGRITTALTGAAPPPATNTGGSIFILADVVFAVR